MAKRLKYLYNTDCEVIIDFKIDDKVLSKLDKFVLDFINFSKTYEIFGRYSKTILIKNLCADL